MNENPVDLVFLDIQMLGVNVKSDRRYFKVNLKDILFVERLKDYVIIRCTNSALMDGCLLDGFVGSNTVIKEEHGTGYKPPKLHIKPPASRMMEFMSSVLLMLLKKQ